MIDLPLELQSKYQRLMTRLKSLESALIAFSGGVDSGLLAAAAYAALGDRMLAVTIQSPVDTSEAVESARLAANTLGFPLRIVEYDDLSNQQFVENPPNRCYFCKLARLRELRDMAKDLGFQALAEGSNADDGSDYRPGKQAVSELGVLSPLAEVGLIKSEVRLLSRALGLPIWDRPSAPCLATRFPYGLKVTYEGLRRVEEAEAFLKQQGFLPVRVRDYGMLARIEVSPAEIMRLVEQREEIAKYFRSIGYAHTSVDLLGYRSGSLNEGLNLQ